MVLFECFTKRTIMNEEMLVVSYEAAALAKNSIQNNLSV